MNQIFQMSHYETLQIKGLQSYKPSNSTVPHSKDSIHICLEPEDQEPSYKSNTFQFEVDSILLHKSFLKGTVLQKPDQTIH